MTFRLSFFLFITMAAFAANSFLNRAALVLGGLDATQFASLRIIFGALMLLLAVIIQTRGSIKFDWSWSSVLGLIIYMFGFSTAYSQLQTGIGALLLVALVQITMMIGGVLKGERPSLLAYLGILIAFIGLIAILLPGGSMRVPPLAALSMAFAGVGWGVFSLAGRGAEAPLRATFTSFLAASFIALGFVLYAPPSPMHPSFWLAVLSGAITSGLGYVLWYWLLPQITAFTGALAHAAVPVIATLLGVFILSEIIDFWFIIGGFLVILGFILPLFANRK